MFKYKINKSINLGIVEDYQVDDPLETIKIFNIEITQNQNIYENMTLLKQVFDILNINFEIIFKFEKHQEKITRFETAFYYMERKKLPKGIKSSENSIKTKIWEKYIEVFKNYQKNISFLNKYITAPENGYEKLSNLVKTIRYLKYDLEKLVEFIKNYQYFGDTDIKKETIDRLIEEKNNLDKFTKFLEFYSKKSGKGQQIFKVALNPAILMTNTEVSQKSVETEIENLKKGVEILDEKNTINKETKSRFLEYVDCYLNHILYSKNFFKESTNHSWKDKCEKIYEKIINLKKGDNKEEEKFVLDFLEKNPMKVGDEIYFDKTLQNQLLGQEDLTDEEGKPINLLKIISNSKVVKEGFFEVSKEEYTYNFIQLNTLWYELSWKRKELKDNKENYSKLSNYMTIIKGEINTRLKNGMYGAFVGIQGKKSKIAQEFSQKNTALVNKLNFEKELQAYTHFGFLIKGNNRIFLHLLEKKNILNQNQGFTYKDAKNILEKYKDENSDYKAYIFQSLTLKALTKLAFIKEAFGNTGDVMEIYKEKSYQKYRNNKLNPKYKENLKKYISFLLSCLNSEKGKILFGNYVAIDKLKQPDKYNSITEFEKDLLKNSYKIEEINIDISKINKNKIYELDIVNRRFEKDENYKNEIPELKRQNDIEIFYDFFENIGENNNYENIRILPEIKLFLNTILEEETEEKKEKRKISQVKSYDVYHKQRRFRNKLKASFLFEYNPLEIGKNPKEEIKNGLEKILQNKEKDDFTIFGIDIGENEFATLGIYDKNLKPKTIKVDGKDKSILNLTNYKVKKQEITKSDNKNKEKYYFLKEFSFCIVKYQINLKEILTEIGEIEVEKEKFSDIKNKISLSVDKFIEDNFDFKSNSENIKKFFPVFEDENKAFWGLKRFLFDFITEKKGQTINIGDYYEEIFKKLEMIKKVNFKDAFGADFVGVIRKLLEIFPNSIIVIENLWENKKYNFTNEITKESFKKLDSKQRNILKSFGAYVGNYIIESLFSGFKGLLDGKIKQYVYIDKNITNSIKSQHGFYGYNGIIFWVDEYCTSKACPVCNGDLIFGKIEDVEKNNNTHKELKILENENINQLFGHGTNATFENEMHHYKEGNGYDYGEFLEEAKKSKNDSCDYNMKKTPHGFSFIESGDDLATYNIAKKGIEYLNLPLS